jgi:hypothetical protein
MPGTVSRMTRQPPPTPLLPHLAAVAREARTGAGARTYSVAHEGHVDPSTVHRFETGTGGWPTTTDELVHGYAAVSGRDPFDLWADAIDRARRAASAGPEPPRGWRFTPSLR